MTMSLCHAHMHTMQTDFAPDVHIARKKTGGWPIRARTHAPQARKGDLGDLGTTPDPGNNA